MKNNSLSMLLGLNEKFLDIFSQIPKIETLNYCKSVEFVSNRLIKINVWRNHTFEYLEDLSNSFPEFKIKEEQEKKTIIDPEEIIGKINECKMTHF